MNALVDEIAEKNSDVADMLELERLFKTVDPLLIRRYLIEECAHIDYVLNMQETDEEGFKEGLEEARKERFEKWRKESARRLRSEGILSDEKIADALDIPVEVVKTL